MHPGSDQCPIPDPPGIRSPTVEQRIFATLDEGRLDDRIAAFCVAELGSGVAEVRFRASSVGVVWGLRLEDGRCVVVKAHQPRESAERLTAVQAVQRELFLHGFPCPEPLLGPRPLGAGLATVESLIETGEFRDTHDPVCRRLIAEALAWHIEVARSCEPRGLMTDPWTLFVADQLWPSEAHAPIFDFAASAAGAEWIDAIAARAKPAASLPGPEVIGHGDWSGKHFRFAGDRITAVYDWDSLGVRSEAVVVGVAAMTFTTNFDLPGQKLTPTPEEVRAFVDEYSAARPRPLTRAEREQTAACATFIAAYTARCEHCGYGGYDAEADPNSFTSALRRHGMAYLIP